MQLLWLSLFLIITNGCHHIHSNHKTDTNFAIIGSIEHGDLVDLGIQNIAIKIDTGAESAALHAFDVSEFEVEQQTFIRFTTYTIKDGVEVLHTIETKLHGYKLVKSSSGHASRRPIIWSRLRIGQLEREIPITLVDRTSMTYRMLLGRKTLDGILVDPNQQFLLSEQ